MQRAIEYLKTRCDMENKTALKFEQSEMFLDAMDAWINVNSLMYAIKLLEDYENEQQG